MRRILLPLVAAAASGCGGSGGDDGPAAAIALSFPADPLSGGVAVSYALAGSGSWDVKLTWSADGGTTWWGATPAAGCATTKSRPAPGAYVFAWDTLADGASGSVLVRGSVFGSSDTVSGTVANGSVTFLDRSAALDASASPLAYPPLHRGHYDLQPTVLGYLADPAFKPLARGLPVKFWRISVGRWEIGPVAIMAPEPACYSLDPDELRTCSREFYRGPNTLEGVGDPANYHFGYLDAALAAVGACGAEPYLCFDYTPFTLASNQDPDTANNHYLSDVNQSFSNGIRTSPPVDDVVYAEVVKRVVMHVKGYFAGGLGKALTYVEIGNEPDLPVTLFWTGTRARFLSLYQACAAALDAEFGAGIKVGAASFAWVPSEGDPTFLQDFLAGLGGSRLDFLGIHIYQDDPETAWVERLSKAKALRDSLRPSAELHVPEWGMVLDGGSEFDDMTAALHHARAIEYMTLFDVKLSTRAVIRDILPFPGGIGLLRAGPARPKPATYVFHAFERLSETPGLLAVTAQSPAGKPMILAGRGGTDATILFFHEAPAAGEVGRFSVAAGSLPFADYSVERHVLSDATCAAGDGLWLQRRWDASGPFSDEVRFTAPCLVMWRLSGR